MAVRGVDSSGRAAIVSGRLVYAKQPRRAAEAAHKTARYRCSGESRAQKDITGVEEQREVNTTNDEVRNVNLINCM